MKESDFLDENAVIIERLKQLPAFKSFQDKDIRGLMQFSKVKEYQPGEIIIKEGDTDRGIYFLLSGKVKVIKDGIDLCTLGRSGDAFGEMAVVERRPRSATVEAVNTSLTFALDASCLGMLEEDDRTVFMYVIYRIFAELMSTRLRDTTNDLVAAKKEIERLKQAGSA